MIKRVDLILKCFIKCEICQTTSVAFEASEALEPDRSPGASLAQQCVQSPRESVVVKLQDLAVSRVVVMLQDFCQSQVNLSVHRMRLT